MRIIKMPFIVDFGSRSVFEMNDEGCNATSIHTPLIDLFFVVFPSHI
jgi:hypothetical protein